MAPTNLDVRQFRDIDLDVYAYRHFYLETNNMFIKPVPFVQMVRHKRRSCSNEKQMIQLWTFVQTMVLCEFSRLSNITNEDIIALSTRIEIMLPMSLKTFLDTVRFSYVFYYITLKKTCQ